ncbi:hypothetical protein O6H91_18G071500 [Diphasiastrum complanatum]|uniref:Uncharacterized protein n=2 Tax=Diphasiastrum complanatum TaxID=34168 RepID=A0ACC2B2J5_DIPCM|nr:hypothetical protein O6H91_18G061700 [Diphasiastrum complanatum]KAJ7523984.1 hypothetical protein O6H91_18G071500 [Diphasiastrum complanatum]
MVALQSKASATSPPWLKPLLTASFFVPCAFHGETNRNECNLYCLHCMGDSLCSTCTMDHKNHHIVQIRRSSYHDVIRVSEVHKVLDITGVQTYIINSAKVVFLNERPQPRPAKGVSKTCETCERSIVDSFRYCSLGCKLEGIQKRHDMTFVFQPRMQSKDVNASDLSNNSARKVRSGKATRVKGSNSKTVSLSDFAGLKTVRELEALDEFLEIVEKPHVSPINRPNGKFPDISPPTPSPIIINRTTKRRKGIPHRAPFGCSLIVSL